MATLNINMTVRSEEDGLCHVTVSCTLDIKEDIRATSLQMWEIEMLQGEEVEDSKTWRTKFILTDPAKIEHLKQAVFKILFTLENHVN